MSVTQDVFKAPKLTKAKRSHKLDGQRGHLSKKRRTKDDFYSFCNIVLAYTQYDTMRQEELREHNNTSPLDSLGSTADSISSESVMSSHSFLHEDPHDDSLDAHRNNDTDIMSDGDSWDVVTCFCLKPFAGRPMIECSECNVWIHLSCAKIRKSNIPDEFICQQCRDARYTKRKSNRIRSDKKLIDA